MLTSSLSRRRFRCRRLHRRFASTLPIRDKADLPAMVSDQCAMRMTKGVDQHNRGNGIEELTDDFRGATPQGAQRC
jgi:hypothetical protein